METEDRVEERLLRMTVGELRPVNGTIELAEWNPAWPTIYRREEARIRAALGSKALLLEHVGSTSVEGLAAKPLIDILLAVADAADEAAYVPPLERAGFVLRIREPDWQQHRMFKGTDVDLNLHVFSAGCPEIDRMIAFRDRLRRDPAARERYESEKRTLAAQSWRHVQSYADAKSGVIESILRVCETAL